MTRENSADPDQMLQIAASDQGLHCLLTGIAKVNTIKEKTLIRHPKAINELIQMIRMDKPTWQKKGGV